MAGIYLLGGATAISPALFLRNFLVPDKSAVELYGLIAGLLAFVLMFYAYRNRPLGAAGVGWFLVLLFFGFAVSPAFWYYKIYLPHLEGTVSVS